MPKDLIVFIPGYTLTADVFKNYEARLADWDILYFDYFDCKTVEEIEQKFENIIRKWEGREIVVVCQSLGFKILNTFVNKPKISRIIAFNPLFQAPKKTIFNKGFQNFIVKTADKFLSSSLGKKFFLRFYSIKQFIIFRGLLGNKTYRSNRLYRQFVLMRSDKQVFHALVTNSMKFMIDIPIKNRLKQLPMVFFIGSDDRLLKKDFKGDYYTNVIKEFPSATFKYLRGGHEGFLEYENEWLTEFNALFLEKI